MKKLFLLAASVAFAQAPIAVFNDFSPTVKGMTIGTMRRVLWAKVPMWGPEVACWLGTVVEHIQVSMPGASMVGHAETPEGLITWAVTDTGKWQMTAKPAVGAQLTRDGTF